MVATRGAKSILEIGAASGYSGIWLGLGARETGGRVVAIEYDPQRADEAAANIAKTGLTDVVRVVARRCVQGDPEADRHVRPGLPRRLEAGLQEVLRSGVSAACSRRRLRGAQRRQQEERDGAVPATIRSATRICFTTIVSPSGEGMSVSYKRR